MRIDKNRPATVREIIHALTAAYVDLDQPLELWSDPHSGSRMYLSDEAHCRAGGQSIEMEEYLG